jgi:osmotically-inducible protein OsmY
MQKFNKMYGLVIILIIFIFHIEGFTQVIDDEAISTWVRVALMEDPRIHANDISISTEEGIVTLTGLIRNLAEKNYADLEAKKISGVRGVINRLVLEQSYLSDDEILKTIQTRLENNTAITSDQIIVTSINGIVRLHGQVHSYAESNEAEFLISEVFGVKEIINELDVLYEDQRTDKQIEADVKNTLERDVYLTGLPIKVSVVNGIVILEGEVGNLYQKARAVEQAYYVWNVKGVDDRLIVKYWENSNVRAYPIHFSDQQLQEAVQLELYQDVRLQDPYEITVSASDGEIILDGYVSSLYQKKMAGRDAQNVVGVREVKNQIVVDSFSHESVQIVKSLLASIQSDDELRNQDIQVTEDKGVVFLKGSVETIYQKTHAEDVAAQIQGVKKVVNQLKINWLLNYSDTRIAQLIKDRLKSNAEIHWVADAIQVTVYDRRVVLTGEVHFFSERWEAGRLAFMTPGVREVENRIHVHSLALPSKVSNDPKTGTQVPNFR